MQLDTGSSDLWLQHVHVNDDMEISVQWFIPSLCADLTLFQTGHHL